MEVGICLPYMERDFGRDEILGWCRDVDAGPWSSLSCGERITGYTLEMRSMLSAAAAVTERVRLMPSLYVLPMHSAVWAAKEVATLDVISGGRVTLCVGVGGRSLAAVLWREVCLAICFAVVRVVGMIGVDEGIDSVFRAPHYQREGPEDFMHGWPSRDLRTLRIGGFASSFNLDIPWGPMPRVGKVAARMKLAQFRVLAVMAKTKRLFEEWI